MSIEILLGKQNSDGGWPYVRGGSWTEPTVYAVMALLSMGEADGVSSAEAAARRGLDWILRTRRNDGGWASRPGVGESTWVTGLVALLPVDKVGGEVHAGAIRWLMSVKGEDTTAIYRLRQWLLGAAGSPDEANPGWPWTPGAAAWVGPTAIAVIALAAANKRNPSTALAARAQMGRKFLLAHMCQEGGWNHGATAAWGYPAPPYPETTGMALLALNGTQSARLAPAIAMGRKFLAESHSADAQNWLQLGLRGQGQLPAGYVPPQGIVYRTVPEIALERIAATGGLG